MDRADVGRITWNSAFFFGSRAIDAVSGILTNVLIARYLGTREFGEYTFVASYTVSILSLSYFGLERITIREIVKNMERAAEHVGAAIVVRWIMSALAVLLLALSIPFLDLTPRLFAVLLLITASEVVGASASLFVSVFRAYERVQYEALVTGIWRVTSLALVAAAVFLDLGITGVCAAIALAAIPRAAISIGLVRRKFVKPTFAFAPGLLRGIVKDATVLGVAVLLTSWFFRSAQIVLNFLKGPEQVALYQVAQSFVVQVSMVAMSISISLLPLLSRNAKDPRANAAAIAGIYRRTSGLLLALGFAACIGMIAFSRELLQILFGQKYLAAVPVLKVVPISTVPLFVATLNSFFFIAFGLQVVFTVAWAATLAVVAALYFALVPSYGTVGAAWAFVAASVVLAASQGVLFKRSVLSFMEPPYGSFALYLLAAVAAALLVRDEWPFVLRGAIVLAAGVVPLQRFLRRPRRPPEARP